MAGQEGAFCVIRHRAGRARRVIIIYEVSSRVSMRKLDGGPWTHKNCFHQLIVGGADDCMSENCCCIRRYGHIFDPGRSDHLVWAPAAAGCSCEGEPIAIRPFYGRALTLSPFSFPRIALVGPIRVALKIIHFLASPTQPALARDP